MHLIVKTFTFKRDCKCVWIPSEAKKYCYDPKTSAFIPCYLFFLFQRITPFLTQNCWIDIHNEFTLTMKSLSYEFMRIENKITIPRLTSEGRGWRAAFTLLSCNLLAPLVTSWLTAELRIRQFFREHKRSLSEFFLSTKSCREGEFGIKITHAQKDYLCF